MTFDLLKSLYFGSGANADITGAEDRAKLHVTTPLDTYIPCVLRAGQDVVLTGNPGDGKSHLARALKDQGLDAVEVEFDLSATTGPAVLVRWRAAAENRTPFLVCANEGPLRALLPAMTSDPLLRARADELTRQLGRLVCASQSDLPSPPEAATLIDLADRNLADRNLVERCLARLSRWEFLPAPHAAPGAAESSLGQNIELFLHHRAVRERFGQIVEVAGRRRQAHITFRQLWATISFALLGNKQARHLVEEARRGEAGLGTFPLDLLCEGGGRGPLIEAVRDLADPAEVSVPELDEAIWANGRPREGSWMSDDLVTTHPPAVLWSAGQREQALRTFKSLKRLVALAHEAGQPVVEALAATDPHLPSGVADHQLRDDLVAGLRAQYISPCQEANMPAWLDGSVPLWVSNTLREVPAEERPHVAVDAIPAGEFEVLRPRRAPWLEVALGPPPEVAWLMHAPSSVRLRVDAPTLRALTVAQLSDGPVAIPEPIQRFLARVAGHLEATQSVPLGEDRYALLERPRGRLVSSGAVRRLASGGAEYAAS